MLKVCHFTSAHPPYDGRIFYKECCSLAKMGYNVYLVAPGAKDELKNGVHISGIKFEKKGRIHRMLYVANSVYKKALSLNADVYHFHDPDLLRFALKLKRLGKKVIFDSHEFYGLQIKEKEYLPKVLRKFVSSVYMRYEAFICRRIDAVIQVCTVEGKDYFQGRCKYSVFVSNVAENELFVPGMLSPFEKRDSVIHVGALTHNRGITDLVRVAGLTDVKVKLAGDFSPKEYHDALKLLPEYKKIEYLGFIDKKDLPQILSTCLAGISTLLNVGQYCEIDTLPTKVYEYMAMGLPVVMSNTTYNESLNDIYKFGICVDPSNTQEIAQAINYLKDHPKEAEEMGRRGQKLVETEFNWRIEGVKLSELYRMLLKERMR